MTQRNLVRKDGEPQTAVEPARYQSVLPPRPHITSEERSMRYDLVRVASWFGALLAGAAIYGVAIGLALNAMGRAPW